MQPGGELSEARRERWHQDTFLGSLPQELADRLLALGRWRNWRAGEVLVREGDGAGAVILMVSGRVKVTKSTDDGRVLLIAIRAGGEIIGELGVMAGRPRSATVTTIESVSGSVVPVPAFQYFLTEHPRVATALTRSVSKRLLSANERRIESSQRKVIERVAHVLTELRPGTGRSAPNLDLAVTQAELAEYVGAAVITTSKALRDLQREGLIKLGRRRITILQPDSLASYRDTGQ